MGTRRQVRRKTEGGVRGGGVKVIVTGLARMMTEEEVDDDKGDLVTVMRLRLMTTIKITDHEDENVHDKDSL